MEREQEDVQFLGFFGIFKESMKIIFTWKKIFSQITLVLILPLSFIFLAQIQASLLLFFNIQNNQDALNYTQKVSVIIAFWVFQLVYLIFLIILSLFSTSAVVYTVASIYTAKDITFKKVMTVVPRVWKRLMATFLWSLPIVLLFGVVSGVLSYIIWLPYLGNATFFLLVILTGIEYVNIVWEMASVVSVLEDLHGSDAVKKRKALIKGKKGAVVAAYFTLASFLVGVENIYLYLVVLNVGRWRHNMGIGIRISIGILCFFLVCMVFLFGLVVQTVFYFVCKSYHRETIDMSSLADHLDVYLGEYVPLIKSKDVQLVEVHHV
ncbi:uncharacterized protein LOC132169587 [Corylus avellana]|uniref:uncharacterized protein LOC132169587 n=1 Tax=Corylus avellana TaxID=13451 RepID=UPI001E229332|nr:uncharacterized protein LOC132169587 [Corylus avellana]